MASSDEKRAADTTKAGNESTDAERDAGAHRGIRVVLLRLKGTERDYEVDFRDRASGRIQSLSVIAGAFSTGKSSVLEFVSYCLGGKGHPEHPEVLRRVRSALLEVELSGQPHVIERAVGDPSTNAFVRQGRLSDIEVPPTERRPILPAGDPHSLSSLLLSHCGLEGVELKEAPTQAESNTDPLSFRDIMWLSYMPNERLDDKNLLFESAYMKRLKLRQVIDVVFGVHDDRAVELGRRVREIESRLNKARSDYLAAQSFLDEQDLGSRIQLELARQESETELAAVESSLSGLDSNIRAASAFANELRAEHRATSSRARRAAINLRDRETQVRRLVPLRAQYADDITKLTMLAEAHELFDPLRVQFCPACLSRLSEVPHVADGNCSLCAANIPGDVSHQNGRARDGAISGIAPPFDVSTELRATKARLTEISQYIEELESEIPRLQREVTASEMLERQTAEEIDRATRESISPFLSRRDHLMQQRQAISAAAERARSGIRMLESLDRRAASVTRLEASLQALRDESSQSTARIDRDGIVHQISQRYTEILRAWQYPKLELSFIDTNLVPHMRGSTYTSASSGGRTLISLAWILAVFEIAWESDSGHPGFLMIDSPQKNLGQSGELDAEFADSIAVADVYEHIESWLSGSGLGAQIIVVDNAPPPVADDAVVVRFSRREDDPPYGLISDETA